MKPKQYKTKMSLAMMEGLYSTIETMVIKIVPVYDDDKLLLSALHEVKEIMRKRINGDRKETSISFTPCQALALRILAVEYVSDRTSYAGNRLHQIANEVHKQYQ